jgi:hypothetical protein
MNYELNPSRPSAGWRHLPRNDWARRCRESGVSMAAEIGDSTA